MFWMRMRIRQAAEGDVAYAPSRFALLALMVYSHVYIWSITSSVSEGERERERGREKGERERLPACGVDCVTLIALKCHILAKISGIFCD